MAFCINCGQQLADGAKFCSGCGTAVNEIIQSNQRKTVYVGEIHKCPNCGEVLKSFVSYCPACGFELNSKSISSVLEKFISEINERERIIANSSSPSKNGWASWDKNKRIWWVIVNILFVCTPLVVYLVLPLITVKSAPKLTKEEKKMSSLIENFPFPNDRESIISALVFSKEKIDFVSQKTVNRKNAYWMRLWCAKADQLKQKADMLFPNDPIVDRSYTEIYNDRARVDKIFKIKAVFGLLILVISIIILFFHSLHIYTYFSSKFVSSNILAESESDKYVTLNVKNFTFSLSDYWEEEGSKNNYLQYYAETGDKVVMLSIGYPEETDNDYDVSFEGLYADNENMIKAIERMFTDGDVFNYEIFESKYGVKGILYHFTYNQKIDFLTKIDGSGYCFCYPSEEDRRWFYVALLYTNNIDSGKYQEDYMRFISAIKKKS